MADSRLRKVSFTGSTPVGKTLLKAAADNVLRTSMELGGNIVSFEEQILKDDAPKSMVIVGAADFDAREGANDGAGCDDAVRIRPG